MTTLSPSRRAPKSLTGALLMLIALGAMLGAMTARAAETPVAAGSLTWGVKASFVSYIQGPIADGEVTLGGGASADGAQYHFPGASGSADSQTGAMNVSFNGSIQFTGHDLGDGPLLDTKLENIRVVTEGSTTYIVADVVSKSLESSESVDYPDLKVATLNFAGIVPTFAQGTLTFAGVPAALTEAGVPAFAGFYEAGTALDPVTIALTFAAPSPSPTAVPSSTPTSTAVPTNTPTTAPTTVPTTAPTSVPTTVPTATATTVPVTPKVTLSKTVVNPAGDTITVTGTGFLPSLVSGARPPLAGQPAGTYIAFGAFAENWKPSAGAPSSARPNYPEGLKWAVPEASRAIVGIDASVTLNPDGSFTAVIPVKKDYAGAIANGNYGIYTYAGSGAVQPLYETFTPVTFTQAAATPTTTAPKPPTTGSGLADGSLGGYSLFIGGAVAMFAMSAGLYVANRRRRA